jgi:hypothetical protein
MRTLLLASTFIVVIAGPALACRGTTEFPQAFEQLEQSNVSEERKEELREQLSQGQSMHEDGHSQGDMGKMGGSLQILDEILKEIGQ